MRIVADSVTTIVRKAGKRQYGREYNQITPQHALGVPEESGSSTYAINEIAE